MLTPQEGVSYLSAISLALLTFCFLLWENAARGDSRHTVLLTSLSLERQSVSVSYLVMGVLVQQHKEAKVGLGEHLGTYIGVDFVGIFGCFDMNSIWLDGAVRFISLVNFLVFQLWEETGTW